MKPTDLSGLEIQQQFELLQEQLIVESVEKKAKGKATLSKRSKNAELIIANVDLVHFYNTYITTLAPIFKPMAVRAGLCPFHKETDPSFHAHKAKRFYHCFGCGYTGDVIAVFTQLQYNYTGKKIDEKEAIQLLANMYNISLYPEEESSSNMDIFDMAKKMLVGKSYMEEYTGEITLVKYTKLNNSIMQNNLPFDTKIKQLGELDIQLSAYLMGERE